MGSKKHKKESKKKKHRSRSRSPLEGEVREHKSKKHKKHKKKERSPDVEEVPVDSHLVNDNGAECYSPTEELERAFERERAYEREKAYEREREYEREKVYDRERAYEKEQEDERELEYERQKAYERQRAYEKEQEYEREAEYERERELERDREKRARHREERESYDYERQERPRERVREPSPPPAPSISSAQESLSIEETNRLRAKLGLKPLEVNEAPASDGKIKDDLGEFYHKPAANIAEQKKTEKIREKLEERKERRKLEKKLQVQTLGQGSDDEDASAWVKKSREIDKQRQEAAKRAALLDEMDAVFGVSALVAEDEKETRASSYTANALKGLRVAHDLDTIADERETILTLADKDVLAEDDEDVLVNVNIVDDERYKKSILDRKKARSGYQAYDDEADLEAAALGFSKPVLSKYDEELDKEKAAKEKGFVIGDDAAIEAKRFRDMMRRERMAGGPEKRLESLRLPDLQLAKEYLNEDEINLKFKKPKKRGKMRKKAKEEPIDVDDYDAGDGPLHTDDTEVNPEQLKDTLPEDDEEVEVDSELQTALARARRLRQVEETFIPKVPKVEEILERVKEEPESMETDDNFMVLDATAEFCRTLGDIPTYGQAGNRDTRAEILDFEQDMEPEGGTETHIPGAGGAWSRVDINNEKPADLVAGSSVGLEAEPALGAGVAGALQLALSKGYLEKAGTAPAPRPVSHHLLQARNYCIEDKARGDDDKYNRRERGYHSHGPLVEFRDKTGFRPNVKLEYVDDDGRPLAPKEAFRYLSHKFHGKGPGKNKQEKRIKKQIQEGLMKKMSSTDTPLGTLQMLQEKQRETHSPYIVLSGAKAKDNN